MGFSVSFRPGVSFGGVGEGLGAPEPGEGFETLVIKACGLLAEVGGSRFHLGGFGSDEWPMDVGYDMSAFMEQFPLLLAGVRGCREVEVDLYPQGVERSLIFRPSGDLVVIQCTSRTDWVPDPEWESITRTELVAMLTKLAGDFVGGLQAVDSELLEVAPFRHWLAGSV